MSMKQELLRIRRRRDGVLELQKSDSTPFAELASRDVDAVLKGLLDQGYALIHIDVTAVGGTTYTLKRLAV